MFAKVIKQDKEIKKIFYERIKEKFEREKQNLKGKIDFEYPRILSWLVKGIVVASYNTKQTHDIFKGSDGEEELKGENSFKKFREKKYGNIAVSYYSIETIILE